MGLNGGGGGTILGAGNAFTGTAQALDIYGDFCAGYSGVISVTGTETDLLSFTSGSYIAVVKVQFNYPGATGGGTTGDDCLYKIRFNENVVQSHMVDSASGGNSPQEPVYMVIPPYTEVRCTAENTTSGAARSQCCGITGRIYR